MSAWGRDSRVAMIEAIAAATFPDGVVVCGRDTETRDDGSKRKAAWMFLGGDINGARACIRQAWYMEFDDDGEPIEGGEDAV